MANEVNIARDHKIIQVLADICQGKRIDSNVASETASILSDIAHGDNMKHVGTQIAQVVTYTVDELQKTALTFMDDWCDHVQAKAGDKVMFRMPTEGIHVVWHAKGGSTTPRSYVADRQFTIETGEISARPAINVKDLRDGRVNMPNLINEANRKFTNAKVELVQKVLQNSIQKFESPFYAESPGNALVKNTLDAQLQYFRRLGPVAIIGDIAAVQRVGELHGAQMSDNMIDEMNANGYLGRYFGASVVALTNNYKDYTIDPTFDPNWLYIMLTNANKEARVLKVLEVGPVYSMESQNIDDAVFEMRLDQEYGVAFVSGRQPALGAHQITG